MRKQLFMFCITAAAVGLTAFFCIPIALGEIAALIILAYDSLNELLEEQIIIKFDLSQCTQSPGTETTFMSAGTTGKQKNAKKKK